MSTAMGRQGTQDPITRNNEAVDSLAQVLVSDGQKTIPDTERLSAASRQLSQLITDEKDSLHSLIGQELGLITEHFNQGTELRASADAVRNSLQLLEQEFSASEPQKLAVLSHFLEQATARQTSIRDVALANITSNTLVTIQGAYERLSQLEDAVWAGRSADEHVLEILEHDSSTASTVPVPAKVLTTIEEQQVKLRSMVAEQLSAAWKGAIAVRADAGDSPTVTVDQTVQLSVPKLQRATPSSHSGRRETHQYPLGGIYQALARLGALPSLLHSLHGHIVRGVVFPLIDRREWRSDVSQSGSTSTLRMVPAGHVVPTDVVGSVETVLSFVADVVFPPSSAESLATERNNFLQFLQREAFQHILDRVLIPAMPLAVHDIPSWLQLVRTAAQSEQRQRASVGCHDSSGLLQAFADGEAGGRWLAVHQQSLLLQARKIVYGDWKTWASRRVAAPSDPVASQSIPGQDAESSPSVGTVPDIDDDGWGFGEVEESPTVSKREVDDDDEGSGWGFDDDDFDTQPEVTPIKPPREATRLAQRLSAANESSRSEPSAPPIAQTVATSQPSQARSSQKSEESWFGISTACDHVLAITAATLSDVDAVSTTLASEASFGSVSRRLAEQLTDVLDFIRATTPAVHAPYLTSNPSSTLQLSNDFAFLARGLEDCQPTAAWPARDDVVQRFKLASRTVFLSCLELQRSNLSALLSGTNRFMEMSNDSIFFQAETAINNVVSSLEVLARTVEPVVTSKDFHELLGSLLEQLTDTMIDDILALDDITEVESERIATLVGHASALDSIFKAAGQEVSSIATFVPHWLKFCYVQEILRANLVDISYLFETGSLVDFSGSELTQLIRALFAESPKRAALLEKVAA